MTPPRSGPVEFGVPYYPEQWPEDRWPVDVAMMKEAGISFVRMAEFSWVALEPRRGEIDFGWLDRAIALMADAGMDVILGTPTATPPAWLIAEHPEILPISADGRVFPFGHRRHYCVNNPTYHAETRRIVAALAERYGDDPRIVAWQIDNEFGGRCFCPRCAVAFRDWLRARYGSLAALNEAWGTVFWSQTYGTWDEIDVPPSRSVPMPGGFGGAAPSPAHALDYRRFISDSYVRYQRLQIEEIRRTSDAPITHNMMGFGFGDIDYHALAQDLDFLAWDNYPVLNHSDGWLEPALSCDAIRGLKNTPFWVMEQQVGPLGWEVIRSPRRGQLRLHTFQMIAHGAEAISYFRWRSARFGTEQHWYGILDHDGRPNRRLREATELVQEVGAIAPLLEGVVPSSQAAVIYDYDSRFALEIQPTNPALPHTRAVGAHYGALRQLGIGVDLRPPMADLSEYSLVVAPSLYMIDEPLAAHLKAYVQNGGVLVLGPRSAFKDRTNAVPERPLPAWLDDLVGLEVSDISSFIDMPPVRLRSSDGSSEGDFRGWFEELSPTSAQALYVYDEYDYAGGPAITSNAFGEGRAVYVGGAATPATLRDLYRTLASDAGLGVFDLPEEVELVRVKKPDAEAELLFLLNYSDREQLVELPEEWCDQLGAGTPSRTVALAPYGVALLKPVGVAVPVEQ
jgi:beta-galactosidase